MPGSVAIELSAWAHAFPLVRGGGLFILIIGAGVMLGGIFVRRRLLVLGIGAAAASAAIALFAAQLAAPLGMPSRIQVGFLVGSIVLEAVLIRIVVAKFKKSGERALLLAILFVVGLHFLPMAGAFGPLCALLGLVLCANAAIGIWWNTALPLNRLWLSDGLIKTAFGALMLGSS
jgi:hypothetical protein